MQRSTVILGLLATGVTIALITSIGGFVILAESQSNSSFGDDEEVKSLLKEMTEMKSVMSKMNEKMDMMIERMDVMMQGMDMMMGMIMGDMMGPMMPGDMMGPMDDMMNQEPQDVIIKIKSGHKVQVGKEAEIVLLVLDKETEKPIEGVQVVVGIERGSSMNTMEMMGDMFEAEDKGSGEYIVRFTPDIEGAYTLHTHAILPGKTMMDNHQDLGIIAEKEN